MATILVTGGARFIGSHLSDQLIEREHKIVILDDLSGGFLSNVPDKATFINGSILDSNLLAELFETYKFDYVYHLAAYAAEGLSHFIRRYNYQNNLIGSINLINLSVRHKIKCFVFTSSIAVYGAGELPLRESQVPQPEDPYGIAKYGVELDLKCAHEMFGLDYLIFRPHNVYGEKQNIGDKYRNVIGIFMNQLLQGKDLSIFGDGQQTRAFTYIDDVAPLMAEAISQTKNYNQTYNIGADNEYSVNDLADSVMASMGITANKNYYDQRHEVVHAYCDHQKIKDDFASTKSETSLDEGIRRMADWVKKNGARETQQFTDIEILEKLPNAWKS